MSEQVKLIDGIFKHSETKGKEYLLYLDVDRLIAPCYEAVSQKPKKPRYGGWESTQIAGHSIGHWLSGAAAMFVVTKDKQLEQKILYALDELANVQSCDPEGYVSGFPRDCFDSVFTGDFYVDNFNLGGSWVPWYSIDKIYAGLIDVYNLLGNEKALEIVVKLADWAKKGLANLSDEQFERMLICEHGGMNEVMADLYIITENEDYLELAKRFCHQAILDPLSQSIDDLEGKHANTQIPKVIGAAKIYDITGEEKYRDIATFFWNQVTKHRSYVTGGNSINEHFGPQDVEKLGIQTTETCNTYNMLKLTEYLFRWDPQGEYMDYYERALYNHILSSQDPDSGMAAYFIATQPGHFKIYNSPDDSFWCCTGTGMENPARHTSSTYYQENSDLYVNLFISSEITVENSQIKIQQKTDFPKSDCSTLVFKEANNDQLTIHIRIPYWLSGEMNIAINGEKTILKEKNGYIIITRNWSTNDVIDIQLPMDLHTYVAKDDSKKQAIMYGPILLAGALGVENFPESIILENHMSLDNHPLIDVPTLVTEETDVNKWVKPIQKESLLFETDAIGQPGNKKIKLIPFYQLHHQRYTIYWNVMGKDEYRNFQNQEQDYFKKMQAITVDTVIPGEQQPEIEHRMKSKNSNVGYVNLVHQSWRDSRGEGFFSYEMKVNPDQQMYLIVTYYGSDSTLHIDGKTLERDFSILVDGSLVAEQKLSANKPESLFDVWYDIPLDLTNGKEKVEVKFESKIDKVAGGVYGVRIVNSKDI